VAAHLEPEILLVDEVLAVGDIRFQQKCLGKMEEVSREGRTVLFVSHNMSTVTSLCKSCILLESGQISKMGSTSDVILSYTRDQETPHASIDCSLNNLKIGDEYATLISGAVKNAEKQISSEINIDEGCILSMEFKILKHTDIRFFPNFHLYATGGACVFVTGALKDVKSLSPGNYVAECYIPANLLNEGIYYVGLALSSFLGGLTVHFYEKDCIIFNVKDPIEGIITRGDYSGPFPGVVRPFLKWELSRTS